MNSRFAAVTLIVLAGCSSGGGSALVPPNGRAVQSAAPVRAAGRQAHTSRVLYVGNIDGSPGVGQVLVYDATMKSPQLIRTITSGTGRPFGLWVDSKNILYVANEPDKYPSSVTEFKPGASSPFFTISNFVGYPGSVAVDSKQNVWVNESLEDGGWVQEFPKGSNTPSQTIYTGISGYAFTNGSMAFDPQGDLLVAEQARLQLQIVKVHPFTGAVLPLNLDLAGNSINGPGMGIDKAGNLYVGSSTSATVSVFKPGEREPYRTISYVPSYGLMSVTPQGAVYEASGESTVGEVAPNANSPTFTLRCQCSTQGVAVSR